MNYQRYRVLGLIQVESNEVDMSKQYISKAETIFQSDSLDEALQHIKESSGIYPECTQFTIERGEWL